MNRANALLFKIRKCVSLKILRFTYLLFLTPTYPNAVLSGLRIVAIFSKLWFYKKKLFEFSTKNSHTSLLFKQSSILKFQDKIYLVNISFVSNLWIIYHHQFLIPGLVFPQITITISYDKQIWEVFNNCKCYRVKEQNPKATKKLS